MPIYDYHCDHCGHAFSAVQSFKDEALTACPSCGKRPRRLISQPSIVFKGSGWYKTDSRGPAKESASDGGTSSSSSDKSDKSDKSGKSDKSEKKEKSGEKGSATPS